MNASHPDRPDAGFTLVELAVVMLLAVLVAGLAWSTFVLARRWADRWHDRQAVERQAHLALRRLAADVRAAASVHHEDGAWTLTPYDGPAVRLRLDDGRLLHDGRPLLPAGTRCDTLALHPDAGLVHLALRLRRGDLVAERRTAVALRHVPGWPEPGR